MADDEHGDRLAFETARLALAWLRVEPTTQRAVAIEQALRLCAHTLGVERVGYFTTKAHGNGIGLATVKAIVDDARGSITVDSAPGVGSTFAVRLPRTSRSV